MADVVRRRGRARGAEREQPLCAAAIRHAAMGWPVVLGAHPRGAAEPGRACSCDRLGCPAPGAHPVSPAWQMQATVDINVIKGWFQTRPEANVMLVTGRVFDVLDVPSRAGAVALESMSRTGVLTGPVAALGTASSESGRMMFFVLTRGAPADEDEWWSCGLDSEPQSVAPGLRWHCRDSYVLAPPSRYGAGQVARWVRPPEEHALVDSLRVLEQLVDACEVA